MNDTSDAGKMIDGFPSSMRLEETRTEPSTEKRWKQERTCLLFHFLTERLALVHSGTCTTSDDRWPTVVVRIHAPVGFGGLAT